MAPKISPKKTWEGSMAGLGAAICAISVMRFIFDLPIGPWESVILGMGLGIVSQIGDLMESFVKRVAGVKDAGVVIPGHGGVLDRLDSLLLTIPVTYYSMAIIIT
jgi:phosphatidate cytidylyltransferase